MAAQIEGDAHAGAEATAAAREAKARCATLDKTPADPAAAQAEMRRLTSEAEALGGVDARETASLRRVKASYLAVWEAWHPNGEALVSAGRAAKKLGEKAEAQRLFDRALVELWKAAGSEVRLEMPTAFGEAVQHIAASRDGRWIALAYQHSISIFDRTWHERARIDTRESILSLVFAPDGDTLAIGSSEGFVSLWDLATGKERSRLDERGRGVSALAYSPDGQTLASARDHSVHLWDPATGKERRVLDEEPVWMYSVAFSPDGKTLASGSQHATLWDMASGARVRKVPEPGDAPPLLDCQSSRPPAPPPPTPPVVAPTPTPTPTPTPPPPAVAPPTPTLTPTPPPVVAPPTPTSPPVAAPPLPGLLAAQQVACDTGKLRECVRLGEALYNGVGVTQDAARGAALFRKACDAGELTGCVDLGWAFTSGNGVTQDGAAAAASFGKACTATTTLGCLGLGMLVRDGNGVARDPARATALFKQACDGHVPAACKVLKEQK